MNIERLRNSMAAVLYLEKGVSHETWIAGADAHLLADAIIATPEMQELIKKAELAEKWTDPTWGEEKK